MVVLVVVVLVERTRLRVTVVKEVSVRRDKVSMVRDLEITGTTLVVVVPVKRVMVETVPVVLIPHHTAVMVNSQQ
tara:strand:+ start:285 stop:509 length:225 start_codon:yes stop_codon:yes gene_type:complete